MYETYDDDELDGKLALLGAPADSAPVARAAQILAMTVPVVPTPRASGVPRWVLGGSVAAALGVGFAGGIVASALHVGLLPSSERRGDAAESASSAALSVGDVAPTAGLSVALSAEPGATLPASLSPAPLSPASLAPAPLSPTALSPASLSPTSLLPGSLSPEAARPKSLSAKRSPPRRQKVPRSSSATSDVNRAEELQGESLAPVDVTQSSVEFASAPEPVDLPAPSQLPATLVDPEELALDDVPSSPPEERIGRMAHNQEGVVTGREVTIPRNGHSPWSVVADGGAVVFDRPAEGIGVSGGLLGAAGARFSPRTAGLVRPAAEARVSLFGGLVPAPGPAIFSPDFHAELVWASGVVRPVLGWAMAVQIPLGADPDDSRGDGRNRPDAHPQNDALALFTTGPELGVEIGDADHVHARIRADIQDSPARMAEVGFRPSGSVTAGIEFPLGTQ